MKWPWSRREITLSTDTLTGEVYSLKQSIKALNNQYEVLFQRTAEATALTETMAKDALYEAKQARRDLDKAVDERKLWFKPEGRFYDLGTGEGFSSSPSSLPRRVLELELIVKRKEWLEGMEELQAMLKDYKTAMSLYVTKKDTVEPVQ